MATRIILEFDGRNTIAKSIVNMIKSVGVFKVVEGESPYNDQFVDEIKVSQKSKGKAIKTSDLWK